MTGNTPANARGNHPQRVIGQAHRKNAADRTRQVRRPVRAMPNRAAAHCSGSSERDADAAQAMNEDHGLEVRSVEQQESPAARTAMTALRPPSPSHVAATICASAP